MEIKITFFSFNYITKEKTSVLISFPVKMDNNPLPMEKNFSKLKRKLDRILDLHSWVSTCTKKHALFGQISSLRSWEHH